MTDQAQNVQDTVPDPREWPDGATAWCVTCKGFVMYWQPYQQMGPGRFAHARPCLVIQGEQE